MNNSKKNIPDDEAYRVLREKYPLDWLSALDITKSILNSLACIYYHEGNKELRKENPDQDRIKELAALQKDARDAFHNRENYSSLERMEEVIAHYGPIIREIRQRPMDPDDIEEMRTRARNLLNEGEISQEGYEYIMEVYSD
jgi:hypothetical protein